MKTTLRVEGMSCDHCVNRVKKALESVEGVHSAAVNLEEKSATVEHHDQLELAALIAAVTEEGYGAVSF